MLIPDLENDWKIRFPHTTRVKAYQTRDRKSWVIKCPYCPFHHQHGCDGTPASAGLRSPHCAHRNGNPDYYLIPSGFISEHQLQKYEKLDLKEHRRAAREAVARYFGDQP